MVFKGYKFDTKWCLASTEVYPHTHAVATNSSNNHKFPFATPQHNAMYIPIVFFLQSLLFFSPPDKSFTVPSLHFHSIYFSACFSLAFSTSRLSWKLLLSIISTFSYLGGIHCSLQSLFVCIFKNTLTPNLPVS